MFSVFENKLFRNNIHDPKLTAFNSIFLTCQIMCPTQQISDGWMDRDTNRWMNERKKRQREREEGREGRKAGRKDFTAT